MNTCLSTDFVVHRIISKLNLREKFGVQGVCRQWRDRATDCLREHQSIVITQSSAYSEWTFVPCCPKHPISPENLIWGEQNNIGFWKETLSQLSSVKYVFLDAHSRLNQEISLSDYIYFLELLINTCGKSLECLCIPTHREPEDDTFLTNASLPNLKHLLLRRTSDKVTRNILNACPNLEHLRCSTTFTDWKVLPKGLKKLERCYHFLEGLMGLLSSPAIETLEMIDGMIMTSEICYKPYLLTSLKEFTACIEFETSKCLVHLARIVTYAPVLNELTVTISTSEDIESDSWIKLLSQCQRVSKLLVDLDPFLEPKIKVSSWQDYFATTIVSNMKNLRHLNLGFHLSSEGLRSIAQLENLQYFRHEIHTENLSYDSVFDTDALIYFLSQALSKKLTSYRMTSRPIFESEEYVILKESFLDFAYKIEQQYFFRLNVRRDDEYLDFKLPDRPRPEEVPGMICVTDIYLTEWDLPEICFDEDEEEGEHDNLLLELMATQSYIQDILLESGQK